MTPCHDEAPQLTETEIPRPLALAFLGEMRRASDPRRGGGDYVARLRETFAWSVLLIVLYTASEVMRHQGLVTEGA